MIQDLFPHKLFNEFSLKRRPKDTDFVFVFDGNNVLVSGDGEILVTVILMSFSDSPNSTSMF